MEPRILFDQVVRHIIHFGGLFVASLIDIRFICAGQTLFADKFGSIFNIIRIFLPFFPDGTSRGCNTGQAGQE